jgi:PAS domain S-box-containing protein
MNFKDAIKSHQNWKELLSVYLKNPDGSLSPDDIENDSNCALGMWISGAGREQLLKSGHYEALKKAHEDFHFLAAKIVMDANNGFFKVDEEIFGENTPFDQSTKVIVSILEKLELLLIEENKSIDKGFSLTDELLSIDKALNKLSLVTKTDLDGKILYANDKFCEISKYERVELIGKNHRIINSGHHSKSFFKDMWKTINAGTPWRGQIKNRAKDGSFYWVDSLIVPILNGSTVQEFVSFRYDITRDKQNTEMALEIAELKSRFFQLSKKREQFFQYVLDRLLYITKSDYGIFEEILVNDLGVQTKTYKYADVSKNELVNSTKINPIEGNYKVLESFLSEVIKSGKMLIRDDSHNPEYGTLTPRFLIGLPIYYANQIVAVVGIANKKFIEEQSFTNNFAFFLEVVVEMLNTINLEEEVKKQTNISHHNVKLASLGQLASGVGHEINNPLNIINGLLAMISQRLKETNFTDVTVLEKLTKLQHAALRITNVVKGLRAFVNIDHQEMKNINIHELVNEIFLTTKAQFLRESIHFYFQSEHKSVEVFGNMNRLKLALINLLNNAKDATEGKEERKVSMTLELVDRDVVVSIIDNGQGISDHLKEKIFDPFFSTKDVNKGSGIGLSLANSILKEHSGKIDFTTTVGVGTKMNISLPLIVK